MARAYIALGSNLGDRAAILKAALTTIGQLPGMLLLQRSSFHETAPVGGPPGQGLYLNAAAELETTMDPSALLQTLLNVEQQFGRVRSEKNAPRTLDLDLLMYDSLCLEAEPTLPHPHMAQREFVLAPLAEIAPEALHPTAGRPIRELLSQVRGQVPAPARLDGVRALVTGATSGIGRATALALAQQGADILVAGRQENAATAAVNEIRQLGRRAEALLYDVSGHGQCIELAQHAQRLWHGVDLLVNVAGADILTGPAKDWPFEQKLAALWAVDVQATIHLSRILGAQMKARGRGAIVTIGWDQAETGMEGDSGQLFASAKAAVMAFSKSLAKSLAPEVRVNCVAPGWIMTAWGRSASETWQQRVVRETPLQRWGAAEDVANAICWIASPAASFVTGQVIRVNGGAV